MGDLFLFELPPALEGVKIPEDCDKRDSNNGVPENWMRLNCLMSRWTKQKYAQWGKDPKLVKKAINPKQFWVDKNWTFKQVHLEFFKEFRHLIAIWIDYKDPDTAQ